MRTLFCTIVLAAPAWAQAPNVPPVVTDLTVTRSGDLAIVSGRVADEKVSGLTVRLSGTRPFLGHDAVCNPAGLFSVAVPFPAVARGTVTATVYDWFGLPASRTVPVN